MQIFFINLDRSVDRACALDRHLRERGLRAERIAAVDGSALTAGQRACYDPDPRAFRGSPRLTDNEVACFLSHREVWTRVQASGQPALVLEDDAQLAPDIAAVLAAAASRVFYDVLRLAGIRQRLALPIGLRLGRRGAYRLCAGPCGSCGYVVSPKGAGRLLALSERISEPIDIFLDGFHAHGLAVYAVLPYPVAPHPDLSARSTIGDVRLTLDRESRGSRSAAVRLRRRWYKLRRSVVKWGVATGIVVRWPSTVLAVRSAERLRDAKGLEEQST